MKKILANYRATTLAELREILNEEITTKPEITYATINSDSIRISLVEETLTDGSLVYNVEFSEVCKQLPVKTVKQFIAEENER